MFCLVLIGFLSLASAVTAAHGDVTEMCAQREVDLIFILALPSSVDGAEMMLLKNAVVDIVEALPLDQVKVAVVTFANNAEIAFDFNDYSDQSALVDAINAIKRPDDPPSPLRRTEATPALVMALNDTDRGHRPNASVVTLWITDGPANDLAQLANNMAGFGEEEFHVMQVGDSITSEELDILTLGVTDRQYQVDSYCDLIYAVYLPKYLYCSCNPSCIRGRCDENGICICPEGWVGPDCNTLPTCAPRDFVFVMDCSKSIKNNDFELLKAFLADVFNSSNFPIGKGEYHVGLIKYGYDVETEFKMLEIFDQETMVQRAVNLERPQRFKGTRTTRAMTAALKMFQKEGRDIGEVEDMFVITDGKATDDKGGSLNRIISNVSDAGIVTFVVTIVVNQDNVDEVNRIAGDPSRVLIVPDFENLDEFVDRVTEGLCADPEPPTTCTPECQNGGSCVNLTCQCPSGWTGQDCGTPICDPCCVRGNCTEAGCVCPEGWTGEDCDTKPPQCLKRNTVLVLDCSDSLTDSDVRLLRDFVITFLSTLAQIIDRSDMRFAAIKYGYDVVVEFNFTFPQTSEALIAKINATKRPDGSHGTRTVAALRKALRILKTDDQWKTDGLPSIILVSDGKATDDKGGSLQKVVDRMDKDDISRYSIGVGQDIDVDELKLIAGDKSVGEDNLERVFLVPDFGSLLSEAEEAAEQFCDTE